MALQTDATAEPGCPCCRQDVHKSSGKSQTRTVPDDKSGWIGRSAKTRVDSAGRWNSSSTSEYSKLDGNDHILSRPMGSCLLLAFGSSTLS